MDKEWKIAELITDEFRQKFPEIEPVVLQMLANRGIAAQEQIDEFMNPDYSQDLHDPFLFSKMNCVVERIWKALANKQRITIYSDYDADGVCSGTVIHSVLSEIGKQMDYPLKNIDFYIPHRDFEGYGMNQAAVEKLAGQGTELIITTDCGISNAKEIHWLKKGGIDVIVVDHHQIPDELPDTLIIHASAPGEIYPFKQLAAVGVAFKVASALISHAQEQGLDFPPGYEKWFLDLVAIATVTDLMPLLGENRTLLKFGLIVLNKTRRVGLKKLIEICGTPLGKISPHTIGFQIGPRINAASRMDHAKPAFELLTTENEKQAVELAARLHQLNQERQLLTAQIYEQAVSKIGKIKTQKIIFCADRSWSPSIVGLVAGRICEENYCPCVMIGYEGGRWIGSGRSIPEFDITQVLHLAEEHLERFGGHAAACGFNLKGDEDLDPFIQKITSAAEERLGGVELKPKIFIECELPLEKCSFEIVDKINELAPFGVGNPRPQFLSQNLMVMSFETMGMEQRHLKIMVKTPNEQIKKIVGFGQSARISDLKIGAKIDLVYELGVNEWNGNQELQFKMIDFKME